MDHNGCIASVDQLPDVVSGLGGTGLSGTVLGGVGLGGLGSGWAVLQWAGILRTG